MITTKPALLSLISLFCFCSALSLKAQSSKILNCNLIIVYQGENATALYAPNAIVPQSTPINAILMMNLADTSGVNDSIVDVNKINVKLFGPAGLFSEKSFTYSQKFENNGDNNYFTQTEYSMLLGLGNMILSDIKSIEVSLEYKNGQLSESCLSYKP